MSVFIKWRSILIPDKTMIKKYSSAILTIFILTVILFVLYKEDKAKVHINELVNMHPLSTYSLRQINSEVRKYRNFPAIGKLGDFYTCMKSYKPESKASLSRAVSTGFVELEVENYLLWLNVGNNTTAYEINFKKHDNKNTLWKTRFSFNCDFNLLNQTSEIDDVTLFKGFNTKTSFKELYVSHPKIELPKIIGELGDFYHCLNKRTLWNYRKNRKEQGMVKIDLDGYILHLGIKDRKAINFMVERYGSKRETLALSKMYEINCELSLLE